LKGNRGASPLRAPPRRRSRGPRESRSAPPTRSLSLARFMTTWVGHHPWEANLTGPADSLLRVERLRTEFTLRDGRHVGAVDDVSFSIGRGETLGLVGESGSGKSVTALSIIRLVPPPGRIVSGRIELEGRSVLDIGERDMPQIRGRRIGFIFQEP